jgi:hypothetical protein
MAAQAQAAVPVVSLAPEARVVREVFQVAEMVGLAAPEGAVEMVEAAG